MPDPLFRALGAALLAAALATPAVAGDEKPAPADPPTPASQRLPAPADPPEKSKGVEFVDPSTIRKPDGWIVTFYRVNFLDPKVLVNELTRWATPEAKIEPAGAGFAPAPMSADMSKKYPKGLAVQNILRIEEKEENWPVLKRVLGMIDIPEPQVYVETKIVEIRYTNRLRVGVESSVKRPLGDTFFRELDAKFTNSFDASSVATGTFATAEKFLTFDYVLSLASEGAETEVRAHPGVIASQGNSASIQLVNREPVVEQTLRGNTVTATTKYEDIGLRLEVQPLFIGDSFVRARVSSELSRVSEFRVTSTSADTDVVNPVISTRLADTVVTVPDSETLVIAGLVADEKVFERKGLPILSDLPVVGGLFGSTTDTEAKTELVFFITLTILRPWEARVIVPPGETERVAEGDDDDE